MEAIYENIGKISGKTKEYLENDYESCSLLQKISYFKPWCWDGHWHCTTL
nr:hypothetical protein [Mycoplasmopsis bovis]